MVPNIYTKLGKLSREVQKIFAGLELRKTMAGWKGRQMDQIMEKVLIYGPTPAD